MGDDRGRRERGERGEGRKPDYHVLLSRRLDADRWVNTRVGAAWAREGGVIRISLEPGLAVSTPHGCSLALVPPRDDDGGGR